MRAQLQAGQDRITAESLRVTTTQAVIEETMKTLQSNLDGAVAKLASVSDGKLEGIAAKLVSQEDKMIAYELQMTEHEASRKEQRKNEIDVVHQVMSNELRTMHGDLTRIGSEMTQRMPTAEYK